MLNACSTARQLIAQNYLFREMPSADLDRLASLAYTRSYRTHEIVFLKGDPGTAMMAVVSGRVKICSSNADGHEVTLNIMGRGDFFGEIALLDGGERTAAAFAIEPSELLVINRQDFLAYLESYPQACIKLVELLCKRLRWISEQFEDLSFLPPRVRLAKRLLHLAECYGCPAPTGVRIKLSLSQQMLASMVGTSRQAVNRQLRVWRSEGLIAMERNSITIVDREEFARATGDGI